MYKATCCATASAISLLVSACSATAPSGEQATISTQAISQSQVLCGFVPAAETVIALLATGRPELSAAAGIAQAICAAVAPTERKTHTRATPMVAGVQIKGQFVR